MGNRLPVSYGYAVKTISQLRKRINFLESVFKSVFPVSSCKNIYLYHYVHANITTNL